MNEENRKSTHDREHGGGQHADDHGNEKQITIIVNGRPRVVTAKELSFEEIVHLADENPPTGPFIEITVAFRRGHGDKPEGSLLSGQSVKIKEGMVFIVTFTDKS